jgi:membrane-associated HD superfamily phosphohydrolase
MIFFNIVQALREFFLSISRRNLFSLSQRKVLIFSNFVLAICSLALFVFSMIVCVTFYRDTTAADLRGTFNSLYNWLLLALAGLCLAVICVIGMRGAYLVSDKTRILQ